jgi:hypothetical protein
MKQRKKPNEPLANFEWTVDDEQTMARMLQNRRSYQQIGNALGRSKNACQERASAIRGRMRDAGISHEEIEKLFPRARLSTLQITKDKNKKTVNSSFLPPRPRTPGNPTTKPEPVSKPVPDLPKIEGAMFERKIVGLYMVTAISAAGIWILAGAFIYSLI